MGLTYAQARYYNPVTARFSSPDPVGFAAGGPGYFNRYAYTMNDPVNMTDPDGKEPVPLPGGGAGRTFFLPESSFTHISNRHGPSGSARQRFSDGFAPPSQREAGILAGAVIAGGEEYFQPSRGSKTFMLNTGTAIGQNGEIAVTVVTRPLSDPDDPALVREVTSGLMENGASLVDPSIVHVVITIAPDDGSMRDRNAVLIPRSGGLDEN